MRVSVFWMVSRVRPMLARMRLSSAEAASLISPLGRIARRMAAVSVRKSASAPGQQRVFGRLLAKALLQPRRGIEQRSGVQQLGGGKRGAGSEGSRAGRG